MTLVPTARSRRSLSPLDTRSLAEVYSFIALLHFVGLVVLMVFVVPLDSISIPDRSR
jgi:hypothetical protein